MTNNSQLFLNSIEVSQSVFIHENPCPKIQTDSASTPLFEFQGANFNKSSIPGMATRAQTIKKLSQPMCLAIIPVTADAKARGMPMRLVNKAYWVAVNFLLVMLAIKATNAAVPIPLLKFSNAITPDSAGML